MRTICKAVALLLLTSIAACGSRHRAPDPTAHTPPGIGIDACVRAGDDADRDGLTDRCEARLAAAFAPVLVTAPDTCIDSNGLPPGGYLHGAQPAGNGVRLVYLPAYLLDCGWSGPKCMLPWVDCSPHAGDSEFIAVDVAPSNGHWTVEAIFLSAHCFGDSNGDCRWYRGDELGRFAWAEGAPIVWVSEGRHANYPSRAACDRGHYAIDTCDRNAQRHRFPVVPGRNIGSAAEPGIGGSGRPGCLIGAELGADGQVEQDAVECFWSHHEFRGWQREGDGATPYLRYLEQVAAY